MIDDNEYYRMRSMYEDAAWKNDELSYTLSEIDFLVESDMSGNETIRRIREVLDECIAPFSRKGKII